MAPISTSFMERFAKAISIGNAVNRLHDTRGKKRMGLPDDLINPVFIGIRSIHRFGSNKEFIAFMDGLDKLGIGYKIARDYPRW